MWMGRRSDSLAPDIMTDAEVLAEFTDKQLVEELANRGILFQAGWCHRSGGHLDGPDPDDPQEPWGTCGTKWVKRAWMTQWYEPDEWEKTYEI